MIEKLLIINKCKKHNVTNKCFRNISINLLNKIIISIEIWELNNKFNNDNNYINN